MSSHPLKTLKRSDTKTSVHDRRGVLYRQQKAHDRARIHFPAVATATTSQCTRSGGRSFPFPFSSPQLSPSSHRTAGRVMTGWERNGGLQLSPDVGWGEKNYLVTFRRHRPLCSFRCDAAAAAPRVAATWGKPPPHFRERTHHAQRQTYILAATLCTQTHSATWAWNAE